MEKILSDMDKAAAQAMRTIEYVRSKWDDHDHNSINAELLRVETAMVQIIYQVAFQRSAFELQRKRASYYNPDFGSRPQQ